MTEQTFAEEFQALIDAEGIENEVNAQDAVEEVIVKVEVAPVALNSAPIPVYRDRNLKVWLDEIESSDDITEHMRFRNAIFIRSGKVQGWADEEALNGRN